MSSSSSSRVTKSPLRFDICTRSPLFDDVDEAHQQRLEALGVGAERLDRGPDPGHVAVVVGAEDVDQAVEAALQLVPVVGDVRRQVGRLAVGADQDPVLVVAEVGGAQPERVLVAVGVAALLEFGQRRPRPRPWRRGCARRTSCRSGRRSAPGFARTSSSITSMPRASERLAVAGSTPSAASRSAISATYSPA